MYVIDSGMQQLSKTKNLVWYVTINYTGCLRCILLVQQKQEEIKEIDLYLNFTIVIKHFETYRVYKYVFFPLKFHQGFSIENEEEISLLKSLIMRDPPNVLVFGKNT